MKAPLPLGLLGLFSGSAVLSALHVGVLPSSENERIAIALLSFTVPLQVVAAVLSMIAGRLLDGMGTAVLAATWNGLAVEILATAPGQASDSIGFFLLVAAAALATIAGVLVAARRLTAAVFATAAAHFALTGVFRLTGSEAWKHVAGIVGIALAALALYAAAAIARAEAR